MTKRETAIISAYTGYLIGELTEMYIYIEEIIGRPVYTHELGHKETIKLIQEKSKDDFISIEVI